MSEPKHFNDNDLAVLIGLMLGIVIGYFMATVMHGGFKAVGL